MFRMQARLAGAMALGGALIGLSALFLAESRDEVERFAWAAVMAVMSAGGILAGIAVDGLGPYPSVTGVLRPPVRMAIPGPPAFMSGPDVEDLPIARPALIECAFVVVIAALVVPCAG
jgi:hypothetical protein